MTSFLDYLKESPDCLYIYNLDSSIYGLPKEKRYIVVVREDWICPEECVEELENGFEIYTLREWFNYVLSGSLIGWECSCLNKKYVLKEHVKMMMIVNPIKLRKDADSMYRTLHLLANKSNQMLYSLIRFIRFSIQIIQNHKIINYKDGLDDCKAIQSTDSDDEIWQIIDKSYAELKSLTDGMIKQEILKKAEKCKNIE